MTHVFFVESPFFTGSISHRLIRAAQIIWHVRHNGRMPFRDHVIALKTVHVGLARCGDVIHAVQPTVRMERASSVLYRYTKMYPKCRLWVAPLRFGGKTAWDTAIKAIGREYDLLGAIKSGVDGGFEIRLPFFRASPLSSDRVFCSGVVAEAIGGDFCTFPSEQTPHDVMCWPVVDLPNKLPLCDYSLAWNGINPSAWYFPGIDDALPNRPRSRRNDNVH